MLVGVFFLRLSFKILFKKRICRNENLYEKYIAIFFYEIKSTEKESTLNDIPLSFKSIGAIEGNGFVSEMNSLHAISRFIILNQLISAISNPVISCPIAGPKKSKEFNIAMNIVFVDISRAIADPNNENINTILIDIAKVKAVDIGDSLLRPHSVDAINVSLDLLQEAVSNWLILYS